MPEESYNVVTKTCGGISDGVITWTSFESEEAFNKWYDKVMNRLYKIVAKGVSQERALELCSTTEANEVVLLSHERVFDRLLDNIVDCADEILKKHPELTG